MLKSTYLISAVILIALLAEKAKHALYFIRKQEYISVSTNPHRTLTFRFRASHPHAVCLFTEKIQAEKWGGSVSPLFL